MTDIQEIFVLANHILTQFVQLSQPNILEDPFDYFGEVKNMMQVISKIDFQKTSCLEQLIEKVHMLISKRPEKTNKGEIPTQYEGFNEKQKHQLGGETQELVDKGDKKTNKLRNACFLFFQKVDLLLQQYLGNMKQINSEEQKQNIDTSQESAELISQKIVKIMADFKEECSKIRKAQQKNNQNQISIIGCESETKKRYQNTQSNSYCRSLLTEKLKNRQAVKSDEGDQFRAQDKIIIKGNWVLREMKGNRNQKGSEPIKMLNFQEDSYSDHFKSLGIPIIHKTNTNRKAPVERTILEEIRPFNLAKKQKKAKKNENGCARCQIY